ncbi:protein ZGRF1-like isoform X2 [Ostrea edulis]|uniref:protein ZGRF1-like isoform X2 n=1 Tax=Ostrea edulis TaxID=37623 RepID=UPI0024AED93D|nr:protein ZGRF1-like isoform X2 [Ostrea edulis]
MNVFLTQNLSSLGSAMNTSKACHATPKMGNNCNIDRVTSPILENCITSHNSHDTLLETEEQILNNISLNESCATSESVTTICLQDEELCKDSVYRRPRKMCFLSPDAAMSPISQVSPISPVRLHGEISPRSQQFEDQGHNSSHVHRDSELVYDVSSRPRQKVADFSGRGIKGRYEGLNDAVEGRYEGPSDAVEGRYEGPSDAVEGRYKGNDAESVVSNWTKYLPVEDEEDINDLNCSYDLDTSIRKINRESQRYTSSVMTFHKTGIYDQVSDWNGFRSNTGNTSQHEVHGEAWGLGSSTSDIRIKQTPQHAARDPGTSTSDRGKQTPQHAAGGPGTSTLDIRGKQTTQHAGGGPGTSILDIRGKQTTEHAAGGPGTSILDIRGKQTNQHEVYNAAGGPGTSTLNIREKQTFGFKNNLHSNNSELLENDEGSDQRTLSKKNMDSFHRGKITKTYMEDCSSLDVIQKPNYTSHQQNERKSANQCIELTKSTNECINLTKSTNQYIDLTKSTNQCVGLSPALDAVCLSSSPSLYNSPDLKSQRLNSPVRRSFLSESQCDQISDSVSQTVPQCVNSHNNTRVSSPSSQRVPETQMNIPIGSVVLISSKERFNPPEMNPASSPNILIGTKRSLWDDLQFASLAEVENNPTPVRRIVIPTVFSSPLQYKQVLTATLKEHLNIILFVLAKRYHQAMSKTDTSNLTFPVKNTLSNQNKKTTGAPLPPCLCGVSSKLVQVRKDGPNKGRFFYSCTNPTNQRCRFFQWADSAGNVSLHHMGGAKIKLTDAGTVTSYFRQQHIMLYCHCQFLQKSMENILAHFKNPWSKQKYQRENKMQRKFFIRLSRKDPSTLFSKDDLWIISRDLSFDLTCTFLARSSYYGPTSGNEVEIEPLSKFSPSNWNNEDPCHAILAGNVSSELSYLDNLEENLQQSGVPILSQLLEDDSACKTNKGFQPPRMKRGQAACNIHVPVYAMNELVMEFMKTYSLNVDQGTALGRLAAMFCEDSHSDMSSILLIHGVFGAGKSFLLSVMIRFLVRVFEVNGSYTPGLPYPWKILISSTTNVAVDRVLMGLLDIGFEDFVRVGSMKKIAKPVLPYSVHATGTETHELKDLQEMLRSGDLSASEKHNVRQSIEKHKLGENKKKLSSVSVVGVTCASCVAPCLKDLKFPVMIVDECSQMTEPASLFPVSKFACQKLVLVGDPKQLDPTIQGSEANHTQGLEQTMFDRLIKMGHIPTMLRTQYRCHPIISNLANTLFYQGQLSDGIEPTDREPLLETLPPLCFYDVSNGQENCDSGGSFSNEKEADFVVFMIEALVNAGVDSTSIGVITLYKSQMYNIMAKLGTSRNCQKETKSILVSTVDAFQGGERDVIILSCVRTNHTGFIDNHKRTNVALTRARNHLFIVGHLQNLEKNLLWGKVITMCKACCDGVQNAEEARYNLGFLQSEESSQDSSSNPKSASSGQNQKRKQEEMESPPMSLSGHTDELVCESPVTISSSEMLDEVPQKQVKRRRGLPQIDVTLLDSDKENEDEDSDEDELPVFNV